jgi:putative DNA-invertase from lambdoid prophage Rac
VAFHSYGQPALCSANEKVRDIVLAVMASLARAERARISERTRAGLQRVRAKGTRLGRPEHGDARRQRIAAMVRDNHMFGHLARRHLSRLLVVS